MKWSWRQRSRQQTKHLLWEECEERARERERDEERVTDLIYSSLIALVEEREPRVEGMLEEREEKEKKEEDREK